MSGFSATELGALALKGTLAKAPQIQGTDLDAVFMGCVLTSGLGQAPARQVTIKSGLPQSIPSTTIGKVCGSGLRSVMFADLSIRAGEAQLIAAGGMESMSNAPYLLSKVRNGLRMGHGELIDSMIKDGLWDVYSDFHMGNAAELCVSKFKFSREEQDAFATESFRRAQHSLKTGLFKDETVGVSIVSKKGTTLVDQDESPGKVDFAKMATLKPVFDAKSGTITAANSSSLSDGAATVLVASEAIVKAKGLKPMARIVSQAEFAQAPEWFTTAPAEAIKLALKKAGLTKDQIDVWEINEAFAAVALANMRLLELDPAKVNPRGGAVSLGHPIGASGCRILVTLLHTLAQTKKRYGLASLCIGGGEAVAVVVENLSESLV